MAVRSPKGSGDAERRRKAESLNQVPGRHRARADAGVERGEDGAERRASAARRGYPS